MLGACLSAFAQQLQVTGTVKDHTGNPVAGATILVEGSTTGTTSNADGSYSITAPSDATLLVSFIGYQPQQIAVAGKSRIDITLKEDTQSIDDVIVVAFGTAKKEAFTGSATVIKSDDIAKSQQSNVAQALAGKVAGVQLTNSSGQPGAAPDIRIRGFSSLNAGNSPLWIVDGMPYSGDLNNLNPNDIESMTVLKDAASNALYGARGANGVVMITTKKAKSKDAIITVDAKWGVNSRAVKDYEYITNPAQFYETHYNALKNYYLDSGMSTMEAHLKANQNLTGSANDGGLGYMVYTVPEGQEFIGINGKVNPQATLGRRLVYEGQEYYVRPDDWTDAAFRTSLRQEYNISIAGSGDKTSVYASFGYLNNEGIAYNSDMDRFTTRLKLDYQAKDWLKMGANATYARFHYNQIDDDGSSGSSGNVFAYTTTIGPIYPLYIRDGNGNILYNEDGIKLYDYGQNAGMERSIFTNSNALSESRLNTQASEGNAFNGTAFFDISFLKDFKFTFNAGVTLDETRSTVIKNPYFGQFASEEGLLSKGHSRQLEFNTQQILNYTKQIGQHNVNVMVGHEYYNANTYALSASKSHMLTEDNDELAGAIIDKQSASSYRTEYNNEGYFARVMYDYASKYFFSASFRRDASSRFHPDHRWGNFGSVGGAWLLTKENFLKDVKWLNMLKLKASYGIQGNDDLLDPSGYSNYYPYQDQYSVGRVDGDFSLTLNYKGNKNITWESSHSLNVGVEFGLWDDRLSGSVEYFSRKTSDMLYYKPVPPSLGYSRQPINVGSMRNAGVEIQLSAGLLRYKNFSWDLDLNMTHYKNKILSLDGDVPETGLVYSMAIREVGGSMYDSYLKTYAGVDPNTGKSLWYVDPDNGDYSTTDVYDNARQARQGSTLAKVSGGFATSLSFYSVDISAQFAYQLGGKLYDNTYHELMHYGDNLGMNFHKDALKAWTPENPNTNVPRLNSSDDSNQKYSSRFLVSSDYLSVNNVTVGYTLPKKWSNKIGLGSIRIYFSGDNLAVFSAREGLDPRIVFGGTGTADNTSYSALRTISGGINLTF